MKLPNIFELIFTLQLFASYFLTGLIWLIQLVHYPSFHFIGKNKFSSFTQFHSKQVTKIVMPLMFLELITAFMLILATELSRPGLILFSLNFILILIIWASTFFLSVPHHNALMKNHNPLIVDKLISTNWIRTLCWTLKSLLLLYWTIYS